MKRALFARVAVAGVLAFAFARCGGRIANPEHYGETPGRLFLWSVHGTDEETLGYLFGSIHLDRLEATGFDAAVEAAFEDSESLVVELAPASVTSEVVRAAIARSPRAWDESVDETTRTDVQGAADKAFIPVERLSGRPPWLARITLTSAAFEAAGFRSELGFEWHFIRRAARQKLPVLELESPQEQLEALSGGDYEQQLRLFLETARTIDTSAEELRRLHDAYDRGSLDEVARVLRDPRATEEIGALQQSVFDARDPRLAARMAALYAEPGREFVVVGAGHLVGPSNVRERLAGYGLRLKRIPAQGLSDEPRRPIVARAADPSAPLPLATIDLPPTVRPVESDNAQRRSRQLTADINGMRCVYAVFALNGPIFLDRLFGNIERGIMQSGDFRRTAGEDAEFAGASGRLHRFESQQNTFFGAIAYRDGFVHTFAVVGPSNRALDIEAQFKALHASFQLD